MFKSLNTFVVLVIHALKGPLFLKKLWYYKLALISLVFSTSTFVRKLPSTKPTRMSHSGRVNSESCLKLTTAGQQFMD